MDDPATSLETSGVATLDVPDGAAVCECFAVAKRALDRLQNAERALETDADSANASGAHRVGALSQYNACREGFVFSNGATFACDGVENFEACMEHFFRLAQDAAHRVLSSIEERLQLPRGWFEESLGPLKDHSQWHLKRYRPEQAPPCAVTSDGKSVLLAVHSDPSLISLVFHDAPGRQKEGRLPRSMVEEAALKYDATSYDLRGAVLNLLRRSAGEEIGHQPMVGSGGGRLEDFAVASAALRGKAGSCEEAQQQLADLVAEDETFLSVFERLVVEVALPWMKRRLLRAKGNKEKQQQEEEEERLAAGERPMRFYYQYPPTLRLQPGPSTKHVRMHHDGEYGHQLGELNFWLPLTSPDLTGVTLWAESAEGADDFHPLQVGLGEIAVFHGSVCRHYVPPNASAFTRASLDFRVGIEGHFDPLWSLKGTKEDHTRRQASV